MNKTPLYVLSSLLLLVGSLVNFPGPARPQQASKQLLSLSKLTLDISSPKEGYFQLEPIPIVLTLSNNVSLPVRGHTALDFSQHQVSLFVGPENGPIQRVHPLSAMPKLIIVGPREIKPGEQFQSKQLLDLNLDQIFPQPGTYRIQAVLSDIDGKAKVKSNVLTIRINEPDGVNIQAYEYIKRSGNLSRFLTEGIVSNATRGTLEEFELNFSGTVYGDYAAFLLGKHYLALKDYSRALMHFTKLAENENFFYADRVPDYLEAIRKGQLSGN